MFGWFKRKKSKNKIQRPVIAPQSPEQSLDELEQMHRAESDMLYQERQVSVSAFDPYIIEYSGNDCTLSSVEQQFLKKIAGQPVECPYVAGYWEYEYGLSFPIIMTKLLKNGYLKIGTAAENLDYLTVLELKSILKKHGLTVSGKKADLISRINENVAKDILVSEFGKSKSHYTLTSKGASTSCDVPSSITKDIDFEDACLATIHQNDFNTAYKLVAQKESEKRFPRGIGVDWEQERQTGLSEQKINFYSRIVSNTFGVERTYRDCIILSEMLGVSNPKPLIKRLCQFLDEELFLNAEYERKKSKSIFDIESYKRLDVQTYEVLGAGDKEMCSHCRCMNGKKFPLSEAKIGVNFPPFCKECRCTTAPSSDYE